MGGEGDTRDDSYFADGGKKEKGYERGVAFKKPIKRTLRRNTPCTRERMMEEG